MRYGYASTYYECPACLEAKDPNEPAGEFEVKARIAPGEDAVWYPNDKAHPGTPPEVDEVTSITPVGDPCRHASSEDLMTRLAERFRDDFNSGDIAMEHDEPYDPRI